MAKYQSEKLHIATYANGPQGDGIKQIVNYYFASASNDINDIPPTDDAKWKDTIDSLANKFDETNKYLWNFERITYTNGTSTDTNRTMISIYSKDGKGILGVYEYYICTETSSPPVSLPDTSNNNGWTKDTGSITLPVPTAEQPYLWNYEIIDYTEGDDTTSGPVCIGTYGNSITTIQEWYQATSDNSPPTSQNGGKDGSLWKSTIAETGHGPTKPYLWNYEETNYSNDEPKLTPITLLAATPRTIKVITEYYQQQPTTVATVGGASWGDNNTNHNSRPTVGAPWSTVQSSLQQGNNLWNMEVIEFTAADENGENLYTATEPAIVGYSGIDGVGTPGASLKVEYQYAENFDEIASDNWSDTYPEIEQEGILWMRQRLSDTDIWSNPIQISARNGEPGKDGSDIEYIYYQSAEKITDWRNKGPDTNGGFTYTSVLRNEWKSSPQGVSETYLYEYMTYAKKQVGATDFDDFNSEPVIWSKWGEKGQDGDGVTYYYCQMTTEEKPVYPTPTDKKYQWTNDPQGVDEEHPFEYVATKATSAIEIYAKKANVGPRTYARAAWEDYGAIGKRNSWTIQATGANNSHINVGDYAYIESITNDDERTLVRLYGEVVALNNPNEYQGSIDLISKRLVFGEDTYKVSLWAKWSKDGEDGEDGEGAYYIYHDKHDREDMPGLPTEIDYTKIGTPESAGDNGWYTIQTGDSVYQTWKICKPSEQPTTSWGPVKRIDGTLTNYNDLWNALDEKSNEDNTYGGIYTIDDEGKKYIGIKADFIKTGALKVAEKKIDGTEVIVFCADVGSQKVEMAGWVATPTSLYNSGEEEGIENAIISFNSSPQNWTYDLGGNLASAMGSSYLGIKDLFYLNEGGSIDFLSSETFTVLNGKEWTNKNNLHIAGNDLFYKQTHYGFPYLDGEAIKWSYPERLTSPVETYTNYSGDGLTFMSRIVCNSNGENYLTIFGTMGYGKSAALPTAKMGWNFEDLAKAKGGTTGDGRNYVFDEKIYFDFSAGDNWSYQNPQTREPTLEGIATSPVYWPENSLDISFRFKSPVHFVHDISIQDYENGETMKRYNVLESIKELYDKVGFKGPYRILGDFSDGQGKVPIGNIYMFGSTTMGYISITDYNKLSGSITNITIDTGSSDVLHIPGPEENLYATATAIKPNSYGEYCMTRFKIAKRSGAIYITKDAMIKGIDEYMSTYAASFSYEREI